MTLYSAHSTSWMMKWRSRTCRTHRRARRSFWLGHQVSPRCLPAPQIASLYVTAGRSSLPEIKTSNVVLPAFLEEIDTKDPNTIMEQALVPLDVSLPSDGQTTGVGRLHLVFRITKLPTALPWSFETAAWSRRTQGFPSPMPLAHVCIARKHSQLCRQTRGWSCMMMTS